ncbi:MAG: Na(+)-translocating NADH-quinone reductase subunit A [Flavobacteriales bacterium]|nr:Na(+)-translocating NADH-quinone reductase subunit A [Flavobacteriales bacterium]
MSKDIKIKRGLNIPLKGEAEKVLGTAERSDTFVVRPTDFKNFTPKLLVKEGQEILAGAPLFYNKEYPDVKVGSPVSGQVVEVTRGPKRKILGIKILADKDTRYVEVTPVNATTMSGEDVKKRLLDQCLWAYIKRRPYGTVARPTDKPLAIYVSGFDSAPLAGDCDYILHGKEKEFQAGLDVLKQLTDGKVHLNLHRELNTDAVFKDAKGVQINWLNGPHPAGNVGVQIHHIKPLNKGEVVFTVAAQDVALIGNAFLTGKYDASRLVALGGSSVKSPKYYRTIQGASISTLLAGNVEGDNNRVISGNVLTGTKVGTHGYLGFFSKEVNVIPEGDHAKFFLTDGWAGPGFNKHSASRSYFSWLMPNKKYDLDTNTNGEKRALVVTGEYESVFPMDIYPQHLVKAIMIGDIELMENLGIYEVDDEDFALCEYVCTSKTPVQQVVKEGLALIEKECG